MINTLPVRDLETSKGNKNWTSIIKFYKNTWMNSAPRASCWLKSRGFVMSYHSWVFVVVKNKIINTTVTKTPKWAPVNWNLCHPDQPDIPAECRGTGSTVKSEASPILSQFCCFRHTIDILLQLLCDGDDVFAHLFHSFPCFPSSPSLSFNFVSCSFCLFVWARSKWTKSTSSIKPKSIWREVQKVN